VLFPWQLADLFELDQHFHWIEFLECVLVVRDVEVQVETQHLDGGHTEFCVAGGVHRHADLRGWQYRGGHSNVHVLDDFPAGTESAKSAESGGLQVTQETQTQTYQSQHTQHGH